MALRKRCRSVGLTRTFTQIASIGSPCSWSDGVDERAPDRGDLLLHGLGTGKRAVGLAIPVARVVQVALEGVHDAVQPRRQRGFLGLDDLVRLLPGSRLQKLQRLLECHGRNYTIGKEHRLGGDLGHARFVERETMRSFGAGAILVTAFQGTEARRSERCPQPRVLRSVWWAVGRADRLSSICSSTGRPRGSWASSTPARTRPPSPTPGRSESPRALTTSSLLAFRQPRARGHGAPRGPERSPPDPPSRRRDHRRGQPAVLLGPAPR